MNIRSESHISGQPIKDKPAKRPVRLVRWFIIVGLLLALLVGALVWLQRLPQPHDRAVLRQQQAAAVERHGGRGEVRGDSRTC